MIIVNDGKMMINCLRPLVLTRNIQSEERGRSTERTFRFAETREHPKQVGGSEGQCFFFLKQTFGFRVVIPRRSRADQNVQSIERTIRAFLLVASVKHVS